MLLLRKAIGAIEKRSLITLSSITLMVILDRVLHQSKEKHPALSPAKLDPRGESAISFSGFDDVKKSKDSVAALQYLLVDLMSVLSRITADILTQPLHEELLKVTWNSETL